ncbi:MAG: hypothetical protein UT48_C0010G0075 [Parcubacteria group bacterium GW2011_GWE2_39_37]|uniref:Cupin type-2 domain-containing protein n=1 Tax=Candidatus Falkowbacteria bacterium GW2011_GWF2_39_8 TaxID=1618642 RepID=A0A0G0Q295_9BACT|nr:MAG: hypothetical protein UT48_C0010G0075 [Parcubacteria group bacterium GW2011_GWE2_39_37]KKR31486.1 MAG: hypothetical protein UT64_C0059G0009 [Candidatus Falkowbacteria bacterium GW2011_GWF2_39_8]
MKSFVINIEEKTFSNNNFREVLFTTERTQLVVMSLKPNEEIGTETHEADQFLRFESGEGKVVLGEEVYTVKDGFAVIIPAGTEHNVINISKENDLKLYSIYAPPQHPSDTVHATKTEAEMAEDE